MGFLDNVVLFAVLPTGTPYVATIPGVSFLAGIQFVLQALAVPLTNPAVGTLTNTYFSVVDD